ncbi:MAG: hypothetical protein RL338_1337 [Chloroflexota bacterium]
MGGLRVYRELLANRPLAKLLAGEFISGIGDWLYIVAIFVVIYEQSGDPILVGAFGAVRLLPYALLSIPAGIVADRFDRRLVLLATDLIRGGLMLVLAVLSILEAPALAIAAVAVLAACGSTFFYPAISAYLPSLVEDERQLGPANSLNSNLGEISYIVGPALGGLLLVVGSVTLAFVANALTFVIIAAILWRLPPSYARPRTPAEPAAEPTAEPGAEPAAAPTAEPAAPSAPARLRDAIAPRPLAGLLAIQLVTGFVASVYQVMTVILAIDILGAGEEANGFLNTAIGIGGLVGGLLSGWLVLRRDAGPPLALGVVVIGAGTVALGLTGSLTVALVAVAVASAGGLLVDVIGTTIFQRVVPNELMGRVTGIVTAASIVPAVVGAALFPVVLLAVGPLVSFVALGIGSTIAMLAAVVLLGPALVRTPTPYEALVERVATLDLFTGVPKARLAAATRRLVEIPVAAGEVVIRQGDPADRFFVIASGTFAVSRAESPGAAPVRIRELGADEVFGELGLLRRSPRTATVTAETDGLLLALEGKDFLELVGRGGPLEGRLLGLYAGGVAGGR